MNPSTELPVPQTIEQDFKQEQPANLSYSMPSHDMFHQLNTLSNQLNMHMNGQLSHQPNDQSNDQSNNQMNNQMNHQHNDQSNNQTHPNLPSGTGRPALKGIIKPTKDEWIQLFEDATNTSAKEVFRNNPLINYGTFCTRFTKYKNGDVEGATMVLGKRGRPLGGGGKSRLSMQSPSSYASVKGEQDTDASDNEETSFGSAPKRIREYRGDEDSDDQPLGQLSQILSASQQPHTPASTKRRPGRPSKKLTESSPSPIDPSLLANLEDFEQKRIRDIKKGIENMRNTAGNTSRATDMLGELEKQELNDLSEEIEAARSAVQAVLDRRAAIAAASAANATQS